MNDDLRRDGPQMVEATPELSARLKKLYAKFDEREFRCAMAECAMLMSQLRAVISEHERRRQASTGPSSPDSTHNECHCVKEASAEEPVAARRVRTKRGR